MKLRKMWLNINGVNRTIVCNPEKDSLAEVLRRIGLTSVKVGCNTGVCGSCSVLLNGKVVRSCTRKLKNIEEYSGILTLEGIGTPENLHPPSGGVDELRCDSVRVLQPGFYGLRLCPAEGKPEPHPGRGAGLVSTAPQCLPVHRLQADRGCGE